MCHFQDEATERLRLLASGGFSLAHLLGGKAVPCCELPYGEALTANNRRQPPADSQQGTEALSPTTARA